MILSPRMLLADDHPLMQQGIRSVLEPIRLDSLRRRREWPRSRCNGEAAIA
jgi:DNA-binding NarL/FixJ family response regulator